MSDETFAGKLHTKLVDIQTSVTITNARLDQLEQRTLSDVSMLSQSIADLTSIVQQQLNDLRELRTSSGIALSSGTALLPPSQASFGASGASTPVPTREARYPKAAVLSSEEFISGIKEEIVTFVAHVWSTMGSATEHRLLSQRFARRSKKVQPLSQLLQQLCLENRLYTVETYRFCRLFLPIGVLPTLTGNQLAALRTYNMDEKQAERYKAKYAKQRRSKHPSNEGNGAL